MDQNVLNIFTSLMRLERYVYYGPNLYLIFSLSWSCWNHFVVKMKALNLASKNCVYKINPAYKPTRVGSVQPSLSVLGGNRLSSILAKNKQTWLENKSETLDSTYFAS